MCLPVATDLASRTTARATPVSAERYEAALGVAALARHLKKADAADLCLQVVAALRNAPLDSTRDRNNRFGDDVEATLAAFVDPSSPAARRTRVEPSPGIPVRPRNWLVTGAKAQRDLYRVRVERHVTTPPVNALAHRWLAAELRGTPADRAFPPHSYRMFLLALGGSAVPHTQPSPLLPLRAYHGPYWLPPEPLVELLKHPFCLGEARRAVLDALEYAYQRPFRDQWDFVAYARAHQPQLDLLTPPTRLQP